jgi:hypothetical protein
MMIMKRCIRYFGLYFVGIIFALPAHAQDEALKKELAYWLKNPAKWKAYKASVEAQKGNHARYLDSMKGITDFRVKLQEMYDEVADREEKADSLTALYLAQKKAIHTNKKRKQNQLIFKVQVQMASKHEIDKFVYARTALTIEPAGKDKKRYLIGSFRVYEEAQAFAEVLRNGGASAYLVAYKNGKRLQNFSEYID